MKTGLSVGDIVRHRVLGADKVIVGIGEDRYLCVYREDLRNDGSLKPEARVAMHRKENLHKVGEADAVIQIDLDALYGKEFRQVRRFRRRNLFTEEVIPYFLFAVASLLIVFAVLSGVDTARSHFEAVFFKRLEEKQNQLMGERTGR